MEVPGIYIYMAPPREFWIINYIYKINISIYQYAFAWLFVNSIVHADRLSIARSRHADMDAQN